MVDVYSRMMGVGNLEILGDVDLNDPDLGDVDVGDPAVRGKPRQATRFEDKTFSQSDEVDFGVGGGQLLNPGTSRIFSAQVSAPFKPERLTFPSEYAPGVYIKQITIGPLRLVEGDPIPATAYTEVSNNNKINWGTMQTSMTANFELENRTTTPVPIGFTIRGKRLR